MSKKFKKRIDNNESQKICFWLFLGIFCLCLFSYGYLVRGAIVNVVERQNMENDLSALNSSVLNLESKYFELKNNVTPELAESLGFVTVSNKKFVNKDIKASGISLLTNNN